MHVCYSFVLCCGVLFLVGYVWVGTVFRFLLLMLSCWFGFAVGLYLLC